MLFRLDSLINLILILFPPISIQGREIYLGDINEEGGWGGMGGGRWGGGVDREGKTPKSLMLACIWTLTDWFLSNLI